LEEEKNIEQSKNDEPLVTPEEVFDVLAFANELYKFPYRPYYGETYSPQIMNSRMKDVNMNPLEATSEKIQNALSKPNSNEQNLIGYTEWLELNSMLFKRILGYFANLLAFDLTYVCKSISGKEDYKKRTYSSDLKTVEEFFDKFNYKKEFKTIMKELLRSEAFFGILRQEGEKYVIQQLPQKYCEITGRFDYGLLFDFDYAWFSQSGVDIELYPYVMQKQYNEILNSNDNGSGQYRPSSKINSRTGRFALWHQTSPTDGFVCFKLSPELATRVPMLSPLMPNIVLEPVVRTLQHNSYIAEATKILYGEVPTLKETATKLKDNIAITPKNLGRFLALLKSALPSAINVAAAPLQNTSALNFKGSDTIFDSYLKTSAASAGINSRLLYSVDRQNVLETKSSLDVDQNMLRLVYYQFEEFLEFTLGQLTKNYHFKFIFEGFETDIDRERRLDTVSTLAESGIVLEQKYASAIGLSPFDFRRMLEETRQNSFVENLTPITKSSQVSANQQKGRPPEDEGDLSDSGSDTRSAGSNDEKIEQ
jgi:hypothetical protein